MARLGYTNENYLNLVMIYGECHKNLTRTCETFTERYPDVPRPNRKLVRSVIKNLTDCGSFKSKIEKNKPILSDEDITITILGYFTADPNASLRDAQRDLGFAFKTIERVLKKFKYRPFSISLVHHLTPEDFLKRVNFCEFLLMKTQEDERFLEKIIWSDEAKFCKNGIFNRRNSHYWADENMYLFRERRFQDSWSFNVYCSIKNNRILCLHIYDNNLDGVGYENILRYNLQEALESLPLAEYRAAWYQHDGAPVHNTHGVNQLLMQIFDDRWIALNGPFRWPPRSPDLTPLDYYIWGKIKSLVYATAPTTKEDMKQRVREAFRNLDPNEIRRAVTEGMVRRIHKCLAANGRQFEHLN